VISCSFKYFASEEPFRVRVLARTVRSPSCWREDSTAVSDGRLRALGSAPLPGGQWHERGAQLTGKSCWVCATSSELEGGRQ